VAGEGGTEPVCSWPGSIARVEPTEKRASLQHGRRFSVADPKAAGCLHLCGDRHDP